MEHLFNCHGEWMIFFSYLPGVGIFLLYTRDRLWRLWRFLCGISSDVWNKFRSMADRKDKKIPVAIGTDGICSPHSGNVDTHSDPSPAVLSMNGNESCN